MKIRIGMVLAAGWLFFVTPAVPALAGEESINLGEYGVLALQVPDGWVMNTSRENADEPPTLEFKPPEGDCVVLLTPFGNIDTSDRNLGEIAGHMLADAIDRAAEAELRLIPVGRASGYFFQATDSTLVSRKNIPDGEYLYLTRGVVATGDLVVTFTILTNKRPSGISDRALEMVVGAVHRSAV